MQKKMQKKKALIMYYKEREAVTQVRKEVQEKVTEKFPENSVLVGYIGENKKAVAPQNRAVITFNSMDTPEGVEICKAIANKYINSVDYIPIDIDIEQK